jgi:hypothetical protein
VRLEVDRKVGVVRVVLEIVLLEHGVVETAREAPCLDMLDLSPRGYRKWDAYTRLLKEAKKKLISSFSARYSLSLL